MKENKTRSMLQRIPVILAVTAASYGLPLQGQASSMRGEARQAVSRPATAAQPSAPSRVARQR